MMLKNVKMPMTAGGADNRHSLKSALKRGFTIMELVIVIAVIAVLAAVLIPTFANLTQRANESADLQTVENLNTILRADETIDGEKPATMQEALKHAVSGGYNVTALTPTSDGNSILWNQEDNRFVLANSTTGEIIAKDDITTGTSATGYKYWTVVGDSDDLAVAEAKSFSRYYTSADVIANNAISASVGVDVSALETAVKIEYTNTNTDTEKAQDVIINGNGGALTVSAATDTVSAYGVFSSVNGKEVADESLHIYAEVSGNISIARGRLVIETGSSAAGVIVTGESVTIVVNDVANLGNIAVATGVSVDFNNIVINNTNTPTSEIVTTTPVDTTIADNFAGGLGTESSPYLIANLDQWLYLADNSRLMYSLASQGKYFSVLCDLDFEDINDNVQLSYFAGYITFNDHTVKNLQANTTQSPVMQDRNYSFLFGYVINNSEIAHINFVIDSPAVDCGPKLVGFIYNTDNRPFDVLLDYVTVDGTANYTDNNTGLFVYIASDCRLTLSNCVNYATIYNNGLTAFFVGRLYMSSGVPDNYCKDITFINCSNYGTIINTGSNWGCMLISNSYNVDETFNINVINCVNYGNIFANKINLIISISDYDDSAVVDAGNCNEGAFNLLTVEDNKFIISEATGATRYEMTFGFSGAASAGGVASITFVLDSDDLTSVDAYEWIDISEVPDGADVQIINDYGTTYKVYDGKYVFEYYQADGMKRQPSITVMAYDSNDNVVGIYVYTY